MGANSNIEWTHHTFNPWRGCTKVSQDCKHCYAETLSKRNPSTLGIWGPRGTRSIAAENYWKQPIKWNADAIKAGERRRVFCASLADVFEGPETMPAEAWPLVQSARVRLFDLIAATPGLDWLLLTKRPENIKPQLIDAGRGFQDLPPHIWIGTSVEDQATADERIPHLLKVPAAVRFLSCEPLLGPVDLSPFHIGWHRCATCGVARDPDAEHPLGSDVYCQNCYNDYLLPVDGLHLHWIIAGGESGAGARPMHPDWARLLRDQCNTAGVAFHFKQWGEYVDGMHAPSATHSFLLDRPSVNIVGMRKGDISPITQMFRVGKHATGRLLDRREWNEFPT